MADQPDLLNPGEIVDGKYEVVQKLGAGGMGEVYKVRHVHLLDTRVIKVMRPSVAASDTEQKRFIAEARLATQIQNPNVAILYDFSQLPNGAFYMVWEYIPGKNLFEVLKICGAMPVSLIREVAIQALKGLNGLHKNGIIHRDISPENIMLYFSRHNELKVKIIDLGIAKSFQGEERLTQTGMFMGKLKYCSPEQVGLLPDGESLDHRTDLYSFGVVLYEMITGSAPFAATTPYGYIHKHTMQPPDPILLQDARNEIQEELNQVTLRALAKDRNERYEDAEEFLSAVQHLPTPTWDTGFAEYFASMGGEDVLRAETTTPAGTPLVELESSPTRLVSTPSSGQPKITAPPVPSPPPLEGPTQRVQTGPEYAPPLPAPQPRRFPVLPLLLGLVLVVIVILATLYILKKPSPGAMTESPGILSVSASPWANITSIVRKDTGESVDISDSLTPAHIALPPGAYKITLAPPGSGPPEVRVVNVSSGQMQSLSVTFPHDYETFLKTIR
ncbi:MAG TPA: serine/threonine-protein kinase [Thermoanaerobaculia bacterium]|nr:serine/threonine-protein kinase [Thermoanaerobaculia bacterium]HUM30572.1 serine/threonine-protein kinase [Thermoanaerobaculia bacterium]HXK68764.1 serine/threonine-protein kinase [Thermoanaerobaculia bacterium]